MANNVIAQLLNLHPPLINQREIYLCCPPSNKEKKRKVIYCVGHVHLQARYSCFTKINSPKKSKCFSPQSHKDDWVYSDKHAWTSGCWFRGTGTEVWRFSSIIRIQQVCFFIWIIGFLFFLSTLHTPLWVWAKKRPISDSTSSSINS